MNYRIIFADTAIQDLHEISFYLAEQSQSREIAQRFVNELLDRCDRLNDFPQLGALPKDYALRARDYRFVPHKPSNFNFIAKKGTLHPRAPLFYVTFWFSLP